MKAFTFWTSIICIIAINALIAGMNLYAYVQVFGWSMFIFTCALLILTNYIVYKLVLLDYEPDELDSDEPVKE